MKNQFIYFPKKTAQGYYDRALGRHFGSKSEKREFMNTHGIIEHPSMESDRHRTNRLTDMINYEREKRGERPKTKAQLMGDTYR